VIKAMIGRGGPCYRNIAFGLTALTAVPGFAQHSAPDGIAGSLGAVMAMASMCGRPTAPIESELERFLKKIGAGPLEADRLRQQMMNGAAGYRRIMTGSVDCQTVDKRIAENIASVRAAMR
jgi:hypothetical protein